MDSIEARGLLARCIADFRRRSHAELRTLLREPQVAELRGASGATYQVEICVMWDERPEGPLRVIGSIDDGGLRAFLPLCEDFVVAPGESSVGELPEPEV